MRVLAPALLLSPFELRLNISVSSVIVMMLQELNE